MLIWPHMIFAVATLGLMVFVKVRKATLPKPEVGLLVIWLCMFGSIFVHLSVYYPEQLDSTLLVLCLSVIATGTLILPTVAGVAALTISIGILFLMFALSHADSFLEIISIPLLCSVIALLAFLARRWAIRQTIQTQLLALELQQKDAQLQTANAVANMAIQLSAGFSHHFNNRLQSVMLGASGAKSLIAHDHPASELLKLVQEAAQRGADMTTQLIAYSQQGPPNKTRVSGRAFLNTVKFDAEVSGNNRLLISADDAFLYADVAQLATVLKELVRNADRALTAGDGQITIAIVESYEDGIDITVTDNGQGIPAALTTSLTEPFVTGDSIAQLGLGLTFVHQVVARHGRQLSFEPVPEGGTRISIWLPGAPDGQVSERVQ